MQLEVCGEAHEVVLGVEGEQQTVSVAHSGDDACPVTVKSGSWATEFVLQPTLSSLATARRAVRVERVVFPADRSGALDPGRSADRITLPSPGWERVLRSTGLGARARAAEEPWGFVAVEVHDDDVACALPVSRASDRLTDARSSAGDHHDLVLEFHRADRTPRCGFAMRRCTGS